MADSCRVFGRVKWQFAGVDNAYYQHCEGKQAFLACIDDQYS